MNNSPQTVTVQPETPSYETAILPSPIGSECSLTTGKLAAALAKAQGQIKGAIRDGENVYFLRGGKPSTYSSLMAVWDACRAPLSVNELAVTQTLGYVVVAGAVYTTLKTKLAHSSGEWESGVQLIRPVKDDPQGIKSAITYARRAGLEAIAGVAPADDSDDDGNAASGKPRPGTVAAAKEVAATKIADLTEKMAAHAAEARGETPPPLAHVGKTTPAPTPPKREGVLTGILMDVSEIRIANNAAKSEYISCHLKGQDRTIPVQVYEHELLPMVEKFLGKRVRVVADIRGEGARATYAVKEIQIAEQPPEQYSVEEDLKRKDSDLPF